MSLTNRLSYYDGSRRNNFTALRFLMAWMVIYAHSFALQPAPDVNNPLGFLLQNSTTTGQMAVDGFFAISGFLVAGSFVNRGAIDYALSRTLRLVPGLAVCVLLTVFVLGPLVTSLPVTEYFSSGQTYGYLHNALVLPFTQFHLPGLFENNKVSGVNGSLWSIPYEARCYIALGIAGLLGILKHRKIANLLTTAAAITLLLSYVDPELFGLLPHISSALLCFALGVLCFTNRDKLILDIRLAILAMLVLYFSFGESWFRYLYPIAWTYMLFFLAYRTPYMNLDQRVGDCSYGIYIYAFPVQQLTAQLMPDGTPFTNMAISTIAVVPLAMFSWLYIEKPALGLKARYLRHSPGNSAHEGTLQ